MLGACAGAWVLALTQPVLAAEQPYGGCTETLVAMPSWPGGTGTKAVDAAPASGHYWTLDAVSLEFTLSATAANRAVGLLIMNAALSNTEYEDWLLDNTVSSTASLTWARGAGPLALRGNNTNVPNQADGVMPPLTIDSTHDVRVQIRNSQTGDTLTPPSLWVCDGTSASAPRASVSIDATTVTLPTHEQGTAAVHEGGTANVNCVAGCSGGGGGTLDVSTSNGSFGQAVIVGGGLVVFLVSLHVVAQWRRR